MKPLKIIAVAAALFSMAGLANAQHGPVAKACASELEQYCKGVPHVNRAARNCLENNRDNASPACRRALELTGGMRGCQGGGGCGGGRGNAN